MSRNAVERIKTVLIVLLTASALLLGWRTGLFNDFVTAIPFFGNVAELMRGTPGETEPEETTVKEAARPLCVLITNEAGERYAEKYNVGARNAVYEATSSIIGEALESLGTPSEVSEDEWREGLSGAGVYYEYLKPIKLSYITGWLGAHGTFVSDQTDDLMFRRIYVTFGDAEISRVYYQDIKSGLFYSAETASIFGKARELERYRPNGVMFAYETDIPGAENAPYMLIIPGSEYNNVLATSTGSAMDTIDIALKVLGHSNETYTTLPDGSDAIRCVGTQFNIRADMHGRVLYQRTEGLPTAEEHSQLSESEMIERARLVTAETIGELCGDAEVFFETLDYDPENNCTVSFGYYITGGSIQLPEDRFAASVTFVSGTIARVEMYFKNFTYTEESTRLLPERQALAAAEGEFVLVYFDTDTEILLPTRIVW